MNTTQPATGSDPCIFELSKHSILIGSFSKSSSCCNSVRSLVDLCSGFSFSSCLMRSTLYSFTFIVDKSNNFFLSPFCGIVKVASFISISISKGTIISLALLPNLSLISLIPKDISSSLLSSNLFLYSNVKLWLMPPFLTCM